MSADGISSLAKGCCATPEWTGERLFVLFPGGSLTDDTKDKLRRYNVNFREAKKNMKQVIASADVTLVEPMVRTDHPKHGEEEGERGKTSAVVALTDGWFINKSPLRCHSASLKIAWKWNLP
ncbi:MAG: hypothetical protein KBA59_02275 [Anaerolineaceae bacterium]|jgi:hypothetical protein|nr:hypothetical protein [Anaerolineaceae bacterium]HQF69617.1 hypothetical protein [Anaerolineaceae bacterium]